LKSFLEKKLWLSLKLKNFIVWLNWKVPKVFTLYGYIFYFFAADCKERAHMHVKKGEASGKLWIKPEIEVFYLK